MRKKKLAIIGNGMGTCRLLDDLVSRGGESLYEITVFGEEPGGAYNRILLGQVLSGDAPDAIVTKTHEWYDRHGVRLVAGTRVTRLDTMRKSVETADGQSRRYDLVVLATGSQPLVPPLEGMLDDKSELRPGAFVYRTIGDCLRVRAYARPGDAAVVLGGGLLGLEAAKVLADRGLHVTVVHVAQSLMNAQLDAIGGEMLCRHIEKAGIFVRTGKTVEQVATATSASRASSWTTGPTSRPTSSSSRAASARAGRAGARLGHSCEQGHRRQRQPGHAGAVCPRSASARSTGARRTASSRRCGSRPPSWPTS